MHLHSEQGISAQTVGHMHVGFLKKEQDIIGALYSDVGVMCW